MKSKNHSYKIFALIFIINFLLFLPTLTKPFLSDDYSVIYRVIFQRNILLKGFFRPLSDITLYICYLIGGLHPEAYNIFNLLIHSICVFLLYQFCITTPFFENYDKKFIAYSSAFFFLIYPFHNESIVWIVGRASSLSALFGFLSIWIVFSNLKQNIKYTLASLCYFIGLSSYEAILPLPAIILILLYDPIKKIGFYIPWVISFTLSLLVNFSIRFYISNAVIGGYGQKVFFSEFSHYITNLLKVLGRLVLPSSDNSSLLSLIFIIIIILLFISSYILFKKSKDYLLLIKLGGALLLSSIIPSMFGISTHTNEGDRLLYFTSFFVVLLASFFVSNIKRKTLKNLVVLILMLYFTSMLIVNNLSWWRAGEITTKILDKIKQEDLSSINVGLINIPQEYNGSYIFRNGFKEALLINGIDTSKVEIVRSLISEESRRIVGQITPFIEQGSTTIIPNTHISSNCIYSIQPITGDTQYFRRHFNKLFYWNKSDIIQFIY